ncbi:MAG: Trm112 family protein [Gammaproteobacteria bacterium]
MDDEFLQILVCPACKGKLEYRAEKRVLICRAERLVFSISADGIPMLLAEEAAPLAEDE